MTVTARWLGGPQDGAELTIRDEQIQAGIVLALMPEDSPAFGPVKAADYQQVTILPRLTRLGWVLDWPRRAG